MHADQELNCRNMNCPLPILKPKKAMDSLVSGQVLKLIATDPGSIKDVGAWTKRTGNELVSSEEHGSEFVFYLKKV